MKETAREMQNRNILFHGWVPRPRFCEKNKKMDQNFATFAGIFLPFPLAATNPARPRCGLYPLRYTEEINAACDTFHVPRARVYAVIKTESNFDPQARSHKGAVGLMQLMPQTYTWICELQGILPEEQVPTDPQKNIFAGVFYLSRLYERYQNWDNRAAPPTTREAAMFRNGWKTKITHKTAC